MNLQLSNFEVLRDELLLQCRHMDHIGLNRGTSGNASVRCSGGLLITPSGVPPREMTAAGMVRLTSDGTAVGDGKPSSEWRMHCDILNARADANAVVHTHSTFATTLSTLRREIPPFHYMIATAGGDTIRCSGYALFGTAELSSLVLESLEDRRACLLGNHGLVALGRSLPEAVAIAVEVEALCEQYWRALQLGEPALLNPSEMNQVIEKFKHYGAFTHQNVNHE